MHIFIRKVTYNKEREYKKNILILIVLYKLSGHGVQNKFRNYLSLTCSFMLEKLCCHFSSHFMKFIDGPFIVLNVK
jgi:hypothetical protein